MVQFYAHEQRSLSNYIELLLWRLIGQPLFSLVPLPFFELRVFILRLFGAHIGKKNRLYPSLKIWIPRNLILGSCIGIGENVYLYNKATIQIEDNCVISNSSFLCTASHDYNSPNFTLFSKPIYISSFSWIAAHSIVMPGLLVSTGTVVGAASVLTKNTEPWSVYAGNPAVFLKKRNIINSSKSDPQN
jgi:putative colanic acid biosynthesis acetyltransferase WcaF